MASVFRKTKTFKVLDSVPGICLYSEIDHNIQSVCSILCLLSEELCPREMVAQAMTPERVRSYSLSSPPLPSPRRRRKIYPSDLLSRDPPSNVLNHPNLTLPASHWKNSTAFMLWKIRRTGPGHISVFKCGNLSI